MSAHREGGKELNSIEEACEKTFMTPPPGGLWRHTVTTRNVTNWRVVVRGSAIKQKKLQIKTIGHISLSSNTSMKNTLLNEAFAARLPRNIRNEEKRGTKREEKRSDQHLCSEFSTAMR